jgi:lipopolysaccharide heptosyltransferase I
MTDVNSPSPGSLRFLIVRLSALGDILHTLPSYRALQRKYPEAAIDWLVEDRFAPTLKTVEGLNRVISVPRKKGGCSDYFALRKQLLDQRYSAAIDFQGLTKSAVWLWVARAPVRVGYGDEDGREISKWFYTKKVVPDSSCVHVVERNLSLVSHFVGERIILEPGDTNFPADPEADAWAQDYWEERGLAGSKVALVNPCAGWETKRWDAKSFAEVATWLVRDRGWKCLIAWGPGEEDAACSVAGQAEGAEMLPTTSIHQLAEILRRSSLCVSGDTGPLHFAAAVGVPCVGVFGGSDPLRNGPYGVPSRTVTFPVSCAPCWKTGCPYQHRECLTKLESQTVIEQIEDLLRNV